MAPSYVIQLWCVNLHFPLIFLLSDPFCHHAHDPPAVAVYQVGRSLSVWRKRSPKNFPFANPPLSRPLKIFPPLLPRRADLSPSTVPLILFESHTEEAYPTRFSCPRLFFPPATLEGFFFRHPFNTTYFVYFSSVLEFWRLLSPSEWRGVVNFFLVWVFFFLVKASSPVVFRLANSLLSADLQALAFFARVSRA